LGDGAAVALYADIPFALAAIVLAAHWMGGDAAAVLWRTLPARLTP